jgi:F-type H+-transporting ATPase subunit c
LRKIVFNNYKLNKINYMEMEAAKLIAKGIALLPLAGVGLGQGIMMAKALEAMGRNPEVSGDIFTKMLIGAALIESIAILAFVGYFIM